MMFNRNNRNALVLIVHGTHVTAHGLWVELHYTQIYKICQCVALTFYKTEQD